MRPTLIAAVPLFAGLIALPAEAQVSARIHLDIPIGRHGPVSYAAPRGQIVIREYDQNRFGAWDRYYDEWIPETVYYYDGYYYDYPIVAYAEPILVYRYGDERFFAPRQREFVQWQQQYRGGNYRQDYGRAFQTYPRDYRNDRQFQPPRDDRNDRGGREDRGGRFVQPQRDDHNGRDDRGGQAVQPQRGGRNGQDGRDARPAQPQGNAQNGRQAPPTRDAGRSRPRPH